ncbi:hypothetical protein AAF712_015110 [Marasmius tenuissimus]|uniref:DUF6532 domain-containing protein n=1 Tax=Marasmius tenuissimus TaxID=585030 RepID=A0ABR2ZCL6_9AGAR
MPSLSFWDDAPDGQWPVAKLVQEFYKEIHPPFEKAVILPARHSSQENPLLRNTISRLDPLQEGLYLYPETDETTFPDILNQQTRQYAQSMAEIGVLSILTALIPGAPRAWVDAIFNGIPILTPCDVVPVRIWPISGAQFNGSFEMRPPPTPASTGGASLDSWNLAPTLPSGANQALAASQLSPLLQQQWLGPGFQNAHKPWEYQDIGVKTFLEISMDPDAVNDCILDKEDQSNRNAARNLELLCSNGISMPRDLQVHTAPSTMVAASESQPQVIQSTSFIFPNQRHTSAFNLLVLISSHGLPSRPKTPSPITGNQDTWICNQAKTAPREGVVCQYGFKVSVKGIEAVKQFNCNLVAQLKQDDSYIFKDPTNISVPGTVYWSGLIEHVVIKTLFNHGGKSVGVIAACILGDKMPIPAIALAAAAVCPILRLTTVGPAHMVIPSL